MMHNFQRLAIKVSGRAIAVPALPASSSYRSCELQPLSAVASGLTALADSGKQLVLSAGGGNIARRPELPQGHSTRVPDERAGILATGVNGCLIAGAISRMSNRPVSVLSGVSMPGLFETFLPSVADGALNAGGIVVHLHGIGQPFVTSDYCAVQRALETGCSQVVFLKYGISAVMTADPALDPEAEPLRRLSFSEVLDRRLFAVDEPALRLAADQGLPLRGIGVSKVETLAGALEDPNEGTWISGRDRGA